MLRLLQIVAKKIVICSTDISPVWKKDSKLS